MHVPTQVMELFQWPDLGARISFFSGFAFFPFFYARFTEEIVNHQLLFQSSYPLVLLSVYSKLHLISVDEHTFILYMIKHVRFHCLL